MATVEDILSNPASCGLYLNHRFYYAIGNTPSVDLTEGCEVPKDVLFLLLGCGDIRNILQTVFEVNKLKPTPNSLTFHIDDIDDVLLARNAVLIQLANTIDPDKREDLEFLWNVWYDLQLSEQHYQRLRSVLSDILENPLESLHFGSEHCSTAIKKVVKYWLKTRKDVDKLQSQREIFMRKTAAFNKQKSLEAVQFPDVVEEKFRCCRFYADSFDRYEAIAAAKLSNEIKLYYQTGSTNDKASPSRANSTFLCPHINGWRVHPGCLPYDGFNDLMFDQDLSLTENCIRQLQENLKSWTTYRRNGGIIKVWLWNDDALTLCNRTMPLDMKFHFINTSNLCDHINLLNILLACSKRLERQGILTVQTMTWCSGEYASVENYLNDQTGVPSYFYATFLGLHLAENFELGTSKRPKLSLSSAVNLLELRWIAAEACVPGIEVSDSLDVVEILKNVSEMCFEMHDPLNPTTRTETVWGQMNTPLTLVYLMKQLATNVNGGVKSLLDIVEECLPKRFTETGEQFCPLQMEWHMLKQFHFRHDLDVKSDEEVIEARIPANIFKESGKPASMGLTHRAVVVRHIEEMTKFFEGQYTSPWVCLSALHYDYETGILQFALPKNGQTIFKDGSCLLLLTDESPSMLVPSGLLTEADIRIVTLTVTEKTKVELIEKHFDKGDEEILMTLCETNRAYSVTLTAPSPNSCIQSFKVHAGLMESTTIDIVVKIRKENGTDTAERQICLPYSVESPDKERYSGKDTVTFTKSKYFDKGPPILPLRRVNISKLSRYTAGKNLFNSLIGHMFTSEKDQKCKNKDISSQDPLLQVKETIQIILHWAVNPPPSKPLVRAYRIKKKHVTADQMCGYFPEDIFIGVRNLHSARGMPTLDIVWLDFEPYRKMVPYHQGIYCPEALMFLQANAGMEEGTCHVMEVSVEESTLLKKILRLNTKRSVQKSNELGSPRWRFNSFIQPVYSVTAEIDMVKNTFSNEKLLYVKRESQTSAVRSNIANDMAGQQGKCHTCSQLTFHAKKCSGCKSVSYCSKECQKRDWKAGHKLICGVKQDDQQSHQETENQLQTCEYCGTCGTGLKKCTQCKAVFYCNKDCQKKDWKKSHKLTCRESK